MLLHGLVVAWQLRQATLSQLGAIIAAVGCCSIAAVGCVGPFGPAAIQAGHLAQPLRWLQLAAGSCNMDATLPSLLGFELCLLAAKPARSLASP